MDDSEECAKVEILLEWVYDKLRKKYTGQRMESELMKKLRTWLKELEELNEQ